MQRSLTVLTVPGNWSSRSELSSAIARLASNYRLDGNVLWDETRKQGIKVHFKSGRELDVIDDFEGAGAHWKETREMHAVRSHQSHLLIVDRGGSRQRLSVIMDAVSAIVRAGGLGVRVESAGIAHSPQQWVDLALGGLNGIFKAIVTTVDDASVGAYSCGMHNFGKKDVRVPLMPDCTLIAGAFAWKLLMTDAGVKAGDLISIGRKPSVYRVQEGTPIAYPKGSHFRNSYGMWELVPAEEFDAS